MLFRIANWTVMGLAMFYVAEGTGMLERGRYFPTLPRMEASAGDPGAWFGAVQWGFTALVQGTGAATASYGGNNSHSYASYGGSPTYATAQPTASNQPYRAIRLGAYAERDTTDGQSSASGVLKRLAGYYGG
ncbi:MAG: hypothetical protein INF43_01720 [Alphaproteobacteria bacterium]|nr:hypothetical protein [Alphaproteobacteria bacterium]